MRSSRRLLSYYIRAAGGSLCSYELKPIDLRGVFPHHATTKIQSHSHHVRKTLKSSIFRVEPECLILTLVGITISRYKHKSRFHFHSTVTTQRIWQWRSFKKFPTLVILWGSCTIITVSGAEISLFTCFPWLLQFMDDSLVHTLLLQRSSNGRHWVVLHWNESSRAAKCLPGQPTYLLSIGVVKCFNL